MTSPFSSSLLIGLSAHGRNSQEIRQSWSVYEQNAKSMRHDILWILRTFADHLCGILKVEHFFAFEERFRVPKEIQ